MKILFISHNAHRAGAQLVLLNFLGWLKKQPLSIEFEILFADGGILLEDFKKLTTVHKLHNIKKNTGYLKKQLYQKRNKQLYISLNKKKFSLFYSNTIMNGAILENLNLQKTPVITHIHELNYWIEKAGKCNLETVKRISDFYFSASKSVKDNLVNRHQIQKDKITPVYVPIDIDKLTNSKNKKSIKNHLGLPKDAIIIGACGTESFRKGKDWFIPIAVNVLQKYKVREVHFVWIGGKHNEELQFDLDRCGFAKQIHFIEQLPDACQYFNEFSMFLMLSREDPFPTVNLEAGIWGAPVLCFDNTGGATELIADNAGILVPYANVSAMAKKIIYLLNNEIVRYEMGMRLKKKIMNQFDIDAVGGKMLEEILKIVKNKNASFC